MTDDLTSRPPEAPVSGPPSAPQPSFERSPRSGPPRDPLTGGPVTGAIVAVNVIAYLGLLLAMGRVAPFGKIAPQTMLWFGACDAFATVFDVRPETLLTSAFLHFSALHLVTNLVVLVLTGPRLEAQVGSARFAMLYVASALAAGIGSVTASVVIFQDDYVSAGASGAICGVLGASLVVGLRMGGWHTTLARASAPVLLFVALLGLRATALQIDNAAHLAGACAGMLLGATWERGVATEKRWQTRTLAVCAAICAAAALANVTRVAIDPRAALDETGRLERAIASLSARRCDDAWVDVRSAERLAPLSPQIAQLREAITRHCGAENGVRRERP